MTKLEALQASLNPISYEGNQALFDKAMIDNDINKDAEYNKSDAESLDKATLVVLKVWLSTPLKITEGGYSIAYDREAILARIEEIKKQWGMIDEPAPIPAVISEIRNATNRW